MNYSLYANLYSSHFKYILVLKSLFLIHSILLKYCQYSILGDNTFERLYNSSLKPTLRIWGKRECGRLIYQDWGSVLSANSFSRVQLFATLWTVAHQALLSMGFPRQEYRSGLPCLFHRIIPIQVPNTCPLCLLLYR